MPSSHCTILARCFTHRQDFDKLPTNARHWRQTSACSREGQSRSVNYQRCDLRSSLMRRRHLGNIWHAKYLELSAIHNPAVWMSSDWKLHQWWPTANARARYRACREARRGLFFFFTKWLAIYKQPLFLALEYTDQVGYMKMKKGLGFFL